MARKHYPEESVAARSYEGVNTHLKSVWCDVRNGIAKDQEHVQRCLTNIAANKAHIKFHKERIVANLNALDALEGVK